MGYKNSRGKDIVTVFSRQNMRPAVDESGRQQGFEVPETVFFCLADGTVISQSTSEDIIIGRRPRQRDPEATIDLEGHDGRPLGVSRQHAMIKLLNGSLLLLDLDSINGTYLNDEQALPTKRYVLMNGDQITCGKLKMTLYFQKP